MNLVKKLVNLLDSAQRRKLYSLQMLVIVGAIFESFSVVAIVPLMTAITNPESLSGNAFFIFFNNQFNLQEINDFVFYYSIFFLVISFISNLLSILTIWLLSIFAAQVGGSLSNRLYNLYMSMNYAEFLSLGSSYITKQISTEVGRLTDNILQPMVQINARLFSGILICILLFIYNPFAAILSIVVFSIAYLIIYLTVKQTLKINGSNLSKINQFRYRYISEGFGAFREIKSFGSFQIFNDRFIKSSLSFSKSYSTLNTIYNTPRYIIEFFVFSTLVFLIYKHNNIDNKVEIISIISVFGLAALKLLPIFQQIYSCVAQIRGHKNALDLIYSDINDKRYKTDIIVDNIAENDTVASFKHDYKAESFFTLSNISFYYKEGGENILNNINIDIKKGTLNAIIGKSGAGKTTLSDIITGLLLPKSGKLIYRNLEIEMDNLFILRKAISLVPQSPYIILGSFSENVAFSFSAIIDIEKVRLVLEQVGLYFFICSLENGIDTVIGDGSIQLSGGQKQRLAIARALYRESEIIFFDEPTSSLDPESEVQIVKLISNLTPKKTIITITHKLSTIIDYDNIIIIENGSVTERGNYDYLVTNSDVFRKIMSTERG